MAHTVSLIDQKDTCNYAADPRVIEEKPITIRGSLSIQNVGEALFVAAYQ